LQFNFVFHDLLISLVVRKCGIKRLAITRGFKVPVPSFANFNVSSTTFCMFSFQIEKSLQRILRGQRNAMYTTQLSIENKVGSISGWKDLLMSVGFRFEPAANGLPPAVFFPQSDPGDRLTQCSASLQAMLGEETLQI
jgi:hypothetical protein